MAESVTSIRREVYERLRQYNDPSRKDKAAKGKAAGSKASPSGRNCAGAKGRRRWNCSSFFSAKEFLYLLKLSKDLNINTTNLNACSAKLKEEITKYCQQPLTICK
jgi:hypothetical protein